MSGSHFQLLGQHNGGQYRFHSIHSIEHFLGISPPYRTCIAYAPYARNAPYCSRPINRNNQAKVRGLLVRLSDTPFPSSNAGNLLKELSSCVVCGITGWHQNKAPGIYQEWCEELWIEYLRANGLDARFCSGPPAQLRRGTWEERLEEILAEQQDDSEEEYLSDGSSEDSDEAYSDGDVDESDWSDDDIDSLDGVTTPDSSTSVEDDDEPDDHSDSGDSATAPGSNIPNAGEALSDGDSRPSSRDSIERSSTAQEPAVTAHRPPMATFSVYRDPEPQQATHNVNDTTNAQLLPETGLEGDTQLRVALTASSRPHLGVLDPNIPSSSRSTSVSSRQGPTDATQLFLQPPERAYGERSNGPGMIECINREDSSIGSQPSQGSVSQRNEAASESQHIFDGTEQSDDVNPSSGADTESDSDEDQPSQQSPDEEQDGFPANLLPFSDVPDNELVQVASPNSSVQISARPFRPYPQLSPLRWLKDLFNRIPSTVSKKKRTGGFIYAYSRPSLPGFLKIGYTGDRVEPRRPRPDPVAHRLAVWEAKCGYPVVEVFRAYIPCAVERIESLVHATLREHRRVEHPPCMRCARRGSRAASSGGRRGAKGAHKEWFEVDVETAQQVVDLWRLFSEERPYDRFGRLVDFWCETVERDQEQLEDGDTVRNWVERLPRMIEEFRRDVFRNLPCSIGRLSLG